MKTKVINTALIVWALLLITPLLNSYADSKTPVGKVTGGMAYEIPDWFKNSFLEISEDVEEAKENDKNVLLFFHLDGCPYCAKQLQENFTYGETRDFIEKHFDAIAINIKGQREIAFDEHESSTEVELSKALNVKYTPTIIFLDQDGNGIYRLNGYRSQESFKQVLNFVNDKAYKTQSLSDYIEQNKALSPTHYTLLDHPSFIQTDDLSQYQQPVALMFEDSHCADCQAFHHKTLSHEQVSQDMKLLSFIRLDAKSDKTLINFDGTQTTAQQLAKSLKLDYRPGIVLFDKGQEIMRIDGQLYSFHLRTILRYVGEGHYKKPEYPNYLAYMGDFRESLLKQGISVNLNQ